jgi:hypothetical protein
MEKEPERIFSGDYSADMWAAINSAKTKGDLRRALYLVCCRLQELEARLTKRGVCPICRQPDSEHDLQCPTEFVPRPANNEIERLK